MNKMMVHCIGFLCMLLYCIVFPQDKPDGFASVSGKGLNTTTGGTGGETVTVTSFSGLKQYAESTPPYIILIKDTIHAPNKGDAVNVTSNKTIVGLGNNATLYQIELHCINRQNIIIRNLTICDSYVEGNYDCKDTDWDGIQADSCHHLWIDHCLLTHNCDGLIDLRKSCDYVTVSWVHLSNHNKTFGIGWTTNTDFRQTIHHCWFDSTNQRNPSFDMGMGHLYNNYLRKSMSYGNLARGEARVVIENSYYENCRDPIKISDNAKCFVTNIYATGCTGGNPTGNVSTMPFNPADSYAYTLDPVDQVKHIVSKEAGPSVSIGEQYLKTPSIYKQPLHHTYSLPSLTAHYNGTNEVTFSVTATGSFFLTVVTISGRTIGRFSGTSSSTFTCSIAGRGLFLVMLEDKCGYRLTQYSRSLHL